MSPPRSGDRLSTEQTLRLLANESRYRILLALCECGPDDEYRVELEPVLERLAETTSGERSREADDVVERLTVELRHNHLPQLEERDVIDWDEEANAIARGPTFDEVRPVVELLRDHSDELPGGW